VLLHYAFHTRHNVIITFIYFSAHEPTSSIQQTHQIVETPLVRAMNQATAEGFQQMHKIVSDDLASMPLESLLNLNHIVPRRVGNLQMDDVS
jgi:hypothetical protein